MMIIHVREDLVAAAAKLLPGHVIRGDLNEQLAIECFWIGISNEYLLDRHIHNRITWEDA